MSSFSYNLPTFKEIENSLERTWDLIQESERLSQKHMMSVNLVCNRCHLCTGNCCRKFPVYSRPTLTSSTYELKPNPSIKDLHIKNITLAEENLELSRKLRELNKTKEAFDYSHDFSRKSNKSPTWNVTKRIYDLESKVESVEKEISKSQSRSEVSTVADEGFLQLSKRMDRTQNSFQRLEKKIGDMEKMLSQPKDRHCARCLNSK